MNHSRTTIIFRLIMLATLAVALGSALSGHTPAKADALWQTSPVGVPQDQVSPLPAGTNSAPAALPPTADAKTSESAAGRAPIPVTAVAGLMAVIVLAALVIGLRRRGSANSKR